MSSLMISGMYINVLIRHQHAWSLYREGEREGRRERERGGGGGMSMTCHYSIHSTHVHDQNVHGQLLILEFDIKVHV